ncbi:MAG: metal-dependent transcriptional regulator [Candidatus Micrarchaeota archaeon]
MASRAVEDYLRAISFLINEKGYARTTDIAKQLGVKSPSVTNMLSRLQKEEYIIYEKYGGTRLTQKGKELAKNIEARCITFKKFLQKISVPMRFIEQDAHLLEHGLHPKTMLQISKFVEFVEKFGERPCFFEHFHTYCKTGSIPGCNLPLKKKVSRAKNK